MASSAAYRDFVLDLLRPLGGVSARAMFGGYALYRDGLIFALISDDALYLKAGPRLRAEFEALGLAQFRPLSRGKPLPMPYYEAPPEMLEDSDALLDLARRSLGDGPAPEPRRARQRPARPAARPRKPAPRRGRGGRGRA